MKPKSTPQAADLQLAQREIDRWRHGNGGRRRIPEAWWQRATQLARTHGTFRVSQALRLSYERLKARLEPSGAGSNVPVRFVELTPTMPRVAQLPGAVAASGVSVELADGSSRRMRVTGADRQVVADMVTAFFGSVASC